VLFEACGNGSEVLQLIEETLDEIAEAVKEGAEGACHGRIQPRQFSVKL
jgi:hypothetical protein